MLLEEYEMRRHDGFMNAEDSFVHLETVVKPEIIKDIYDNRMRLSPSTLKDHTKSEELTMEYLNSLEDTIRQDEYGNNTVRISSRYNKTGKLNEITTGMKEIYKALRNRDSNIDEMIDIKVQYHCYLYEFILIYRHLNIVVKK